MAAMNKTRVLIFGAAVAAAMIFGGVVGATVLGKTTLTSVSAAITAASPSPGPFKSNETTAHEAGESAAQETAENNGTFRPAGPGGPGGGPSNEAAAHEATESAAREAAEKT
jgi:hypothetical protein